MFSMVNLFVICLVLCVIGKTETTLGLNYVTKTCTVERVSEMLGYVCHNLNLREIPQHLNSSLQVLDVSLNRIRQLNENSFARYTGVKYLYLFENLIQTIEANTFSQLNSLEAIDLSDNGITTLPMELFSLPLLRNIHTSGNPLVNLERDLKNLPKPLTAPLKLINIASCKLSKVPDFGVLPELIELNISSNNLLDITPQQLLPFCSLASVDVTNTKIPPCPCQALRHYFHRRSIAIPNDMNCDNSVEVLENCPDSSNSTMDSESYWQCRNLQKERKLEKKCHGFTE